MTHCCHGHAQFAIPVSGLCEGDIAQKGSLLPCLPTSHIGSYLYDDTLQRFRRWSTLSIQPMSFGRLDGGGLSKWRKMLGEKGVINGAIIGHGNGRNDPAMVG